MENINRQLEQPMSNQASASRRANSSRLSARRVWCIVLLMLIGHWLMMHWLVAWLGAEESKVYGQSAKESTLDDGWRRTANGWEYHMNQPRDVHRPTVTRSIKSSTLQIWPAAAAACILLLIIGLPDKKQ